MLDHGLDLEQLARDAIARGADCLGMAGGDGSQALVASIAVECGVPFVCVTAGTRNHFAQDLGLDRDDPRTSVHAFRDGSNGGSTTPRSTIGSSSTTSHSASTRRSCSRTATATRRWRRPRRCCRSCWARRTRRSISSSPSRTAPRSTARSSSRSRTTRMRSAPRSTPGNDAASTPASSVSSPSPEPPGRTPPGLLALDAVGRRNRSRNWHEFTTASFEVRSRSGTAFAGVDGEALEMTTPMVFRIHPGGLRLLVPEGNLDAAQRRRARNVSLRDLFDVARGRS